MCLGIWIEFRLLLKKYNLQLHLPSDTDPITGIGGALLVLWLFFLDSVVDWWYWWLNPSAKKSLFPFNEPVALRFFRCGLGGFTPSPFCRPVRPAILLIFASIKCWPPAIPTELLAMLTQLTPFWLRGFRDFRVWLVSMWVIKLWYRVAAITMASSGDWQTKAWHSSWRCTSNDRITTANMGEWRPDDSRRLSDALDKDFN